ncbi:hypothetical protein CBL_01720 [Carabus blaptoides fortunei]
MAFSKTTNVAASSSTNKSDENTTQFLTVVPDTIVCQFPIEHEFALIVEYQKDDGKQVICLAHMPYVPMKCQQLKGTHTRIQTQKSHRQRGTDMKSNISSRGREAKAIIIFTRRVKRESGAESQSKNLK